MLWSNRRDNIVDSRLKYSLGWPVLKGMRVHMPFSRSLQHSDRLRHVESTVLLIECVCMLFVKMCSATSLSGKWVVRGKKRVRSGRKAIRWDFFGASNFVTGIQLAQMPSILHRQKAFTKLHVIPTSHTAPTTSFLHKRRCAVRDGKSDVCD